MDFGIYLKFVLVLVFVLARIGVAAALARRFGLGHGPRAVNGERRLSVCEVMPLDGKRRLVLLRRDSIEHLILLGPTSETLIERAIPTAEPFAAVIKAKVVRRGAAPAPAAGAPDRRPCEDLESSQNNPLETGR